MKFDIRFYIVMIFGIFFTSILYESYQYDNIFQIFFYVIFGAIILYNFYNNLFEKEGNFKKFALLKNSPTFLVGSFTILINISIVTYYEIKLNAETYIKAENYGVIWILKKMDNI